KLNSIRNSIAFFVLLLLGGDSFAQGKPTLQSSYSFQHISAANGLVSNVVNMTIQDEEGYMWIATINGLQRFDGNRLLTFMHEEGTASTIPNDNIVAMLLDKDKNLWILSALGYVGIFDKKKFTYKASSIKVKNESILRAIKYMFEDDQGNIFIHLAPHEILTYKKSTNEFSAANTFIPTPLNWHYWSATYDPKDKTFWMAADSGLVVFNPKTKKLSYRNHNEEN